MGVFRDLRPGKRHPGRILHGRLCVRPFKICAFIHTVLEEEEPDSGKAISLKIRLAASSLAGDADVEVMYEQGMRVAVKEPFFMDFPGHFVGLRVDDPGDIIRLDLEKVSEPVRAIPRGDELMELHSAEQLRKEGNVCFAQKDWNKAIELYSRCIEEIRLNARAVQEAVEARASACRADIVCNAKPGTHAKRKSKQARSRKKKKEAAAVLAQGAFEVAAAMLLTAAFSNRSEAWLRLKHYENAYRDAQGALSLTPSHDKSTLRKGKALHGLQCFKQAISCYQEMLDLPPSRLSAETRDQIKGTLIREAQVSEIQTRLGKYNLDDYFVGGCRGDPPACADHVGPVEVRYVNQTIGRGLFVTRDVKEGELLLVSNPVAVARASPNVGVGHGLSEGAEANNAVLQDLTAQLRDAAKRSSRTIQQLYTLSDGNKARKGEVPPMSVFTPLAPTLPSYEEDFELLSDMKKIEKLAEDQDYGETQVDNPRIRRIVDINVFEGNRFTSSSVINLVWVPENEIPAGVWILPSFINHSCTPNSSRRYVGDVMFINASRDLQAGEEITVAYFHLFIPGHERKALSEKRGFCCCCSRCSLEQSLLSRAPALRRVSQKYVKYTALTDAVGTFGAASRGACIRRDLNQFLETNTMQLTLEGKNWIRASYIRPYLQAIVQVLSRRVTGVKSSITTQTFDMVFDAMVSVHPGSEDTLSMLCHAFSYGTAELTPGKSKSWADLALRICKCIYGSFKESTGEAILKHHTESSLRYMEKQVASHLDILRFEWCFPVR